MRYTIKELRNKNFKKVSYKGYEYIILDTLPGYYHCDTYMESMRAIKVAEIKVGEIPLYRVRWEITNPNDKYESHTCDWEFPSQVEKSGTIDIAQTVSVTVRFYDSNDMEISADEESFEAESEAEIIEYAKEVELYGNVAYANVYADDDDEPILSVTSKEAVASIREKEYEEEY